MKITKSKMKAKDGSVNTFISRGISTNPIIKIGPSAGMNVNKSLLLNSAEMTLPSNEYKINR